MSNQIPIYREQFQAAMEEITKNRGKVQKIYGNLIYFESDKTNYVFVPQMTDGGPMFMKREAKDFAQG